MEIAELKEMEEAKALVLRLSNLPRDFKKIESTEDFREHDNMLLTLKDLRDESDELRRSITRPMDEAKSDVIEWFNTHLLSDIQHSISSLTMAIRIYIGGIEKANNAAKTKAEAKRRKEQERLEKRADAAEKKGEHEKAAALRGQAYKKVPPNPAHRIPRSKGVSRKQDWQYYIKDESLIPRDLMMPNEAVIGSVVKAMKGRTDIPGVVVYDANSYEALTA